VADEVLPSRHVTDVPPLLVVLDLLGRVVGDGEVSVHPEDVALCAVSAVGSGVCGGHRQICRGVVVVHVLNHRTQSDQHCALCATGLLLLVN